MTKSPARTTSSSSVRVVMASPASDAAEGEGAGVAHEDLGGGGVPPQEAEARAHDRGGDDGEVEGVAHLVAVGTGHLDHLAGLAGLPDADQDERARHHRRRTRREPVEPVRDVHAVAGRGDDHLRPQDEQQEPEDGSGEREVDRGVADHRDVRRRGGAVGVVGEPQREHREHEPDDGLADQLRPRTQPEAALPGDLDEVVEEADDAEAGHEEQDEDGGGRRRRQGEHVRADVRGQGGTDDDGAAHRGRPALGVVRGRSVVADELAVLAPHQEPDVQGGGEQRDHQRDGRRGQDGPHGVAPGGDASTIPGTTSRVSGGPCHPWWRHAPQANRASGRPSAGVGPVQCSTAVCSPPGDPASRYRPTTHHQERSHRC